MTVDTTGNNMHARHAAPQYGWAPPAGQPQGNAWYMANAGSYPAAPQGPRVQPMPMAQSPRSGRFLQGLLIGGVAAYLLSNEQVQQSVIRSAVRVWSTVQGGMEEMKERFRDAEAELHAAEPHE